ncbi:MAG: helix-turn-helix domain-containing protein [Bdellovibrionales bacterium]|nr:helix-turn-helix domain-containing protein [Bdellovibrionales bacterium]
MRIKSRAGKDKEQLNLFDCNNALELSKLKKQVKVEPTDEIIISRSNTDPLFDNLISVKTVSEMLGIAPKTIHNWIYLRKIPYMKVGQRVMFRPKSLKAWLNRKEIKPWL